MAEPAIANLGAYVLPGDPVWLARTLRQYYPLVSRIVVPVPRDGLSWTGRPLPVEDTLAVIRENDPRGIVETIDGAWSNPDRPRDAGTAQRQAAVDALGDSVAWVLQIDNDEYLPRPERLSDAIDAAQSVGAHAVEWPMRVLYRRTRRAVYEVVSEDGRPTYDYPGPVLVRAGARLTEARRSEGRVLRLVVTGDDRSLQVTRPAGENETLMELLQPEDAILHNSWARAPQDVWRKVTSSGHARDYGLVRYYVTRWWPAPALWRVQRDLHPFSGGLWPALARRPNAGVYAD